MTCLCFFLYFLYSDFNEKLQGVSPGTIRTSVPEARKPPLMYLQRVQVGGASAPPRQVAALKTHYRPRVCGRRGVPPTFYNGARVATDWPTRGTSRPCCHLPLPLAGAYVSDLPPPPPYLWQ